MIPLRGGGTPFKCIGSHRWPHEPAVREYTGEEWFMVTRCQLRVIGSTGDYRSGLGMLLRPIQEIEFQRYEKSLEQIMEFLHGPFDLFDAAMDNLELCLSRQKRLADYPSADPYFWLQSTREVEGAISQAAFAFTGYTDAMRSRASNRHGSASPETTEVIRLISKTYDAWPEYRVAVGLRNALAHSDEPILTSVRANEAGEARVFLIAETFVANSRLNRKVRDEVRTITDGSDIDVIAMMRRLRHVVRGLDKEIKDVLQPNIHQAAHHVNSLAIEAKLRGGFPQVVCRTRDQRIYSLPIPTEALDYAIQSVVVWESVVESIWPSDSAEAAMLRLGAHALSLKAYDRDALLGPVRVA